MNISIASELLKRHMQFYTGLRFIVIEVDERVSKGWEIAYVPREMMRKTTVKVS